MKMKPEEVGSNAGIREVSVVDDSIDNGI